MNDLLINKYKPKTINDFFIDNNNLILLENFIINNYYNLIIEGENGSGKSSLINIIINNYFSNKKDLFDSNVCYITLLKDQGINYYKNDVRIFINNCLNNNYKKFIIIEDIELFSDLVQSYFLELIKNYKSNVYFILSSCNIVKINKNFNNILDIIKLKKIDNNYLMKILDNILNIENIVISSDIKNYIINLSNNSINNLINNIEKIKLLHNNFLTFEDIKKLDIESDIVILEFDKLINYCFKNNKQEALNFLLDLIEKGYSLIDILDNFLYYIKNINISINEETKYLIIKQTINYLNNYFTIDEDNIEIIFFMNNLYNLLQNNK